MAKHILVTANQYQALAARTLIAKPDFEIKPEDLMLVWNGLGIAGEAGEVSDEIKKAIFHQHGINKDKIIKELGDTLWYAAAICTNLGISLSEVMSANIDKLQQRYPEGYSSEASKIAHSQKADQ